MISNALNIYRALQNRDISRESLLKNELQYKDIFPLILASNFEFACPDGQNPKEYNPLTDFLSENNHKNLVLFLNQIEK